MENRNQNSASNHPNEKGANCNVSIARPFLIFLALALVIAGVLYVLFK